jgi:hypothetical protein
MTDWYLYTQNRCVSALCQSSGILQTRKHDVSETASVSLLCSFHHSPIISSHLSPNILLSTLFSNTISLCSSPKVRDQLSHPTRTRDKIIVLYILIFMFLNRRQKVLDWMVASITRLQSPLNFLLNQILSSCCCLQIFQLRHIFKLFVSNSYVLILTSFMVMRQQHVLSFLYVYF